MNLHGVLEKCGFKCWYDMNADDLTANGMDIGVHKSDIYILFLSEGVLGRPFVQRELREARKKEKKIVLVHGE